MLQAVFKTDRGGGAASLEESAGIDSLVKQLEDRWGGTSAIDEPNQEQLFRNSEVVYVGPRTSQSTKSARSRLRGLGRLAFRTVGRYQELLNTAGSTGPEEESNGVGEFTAVNLNKFRVLGFIPGSVVRQGVVTRDAESRNSVVVDFESPKVKLGFIPQLRIGVGASSVRLDITYVGARLRVSREAATGRLFLLTPMN